MSPKRNKGNRRKVRQSLRQYERYTPEELEELDEMNQKQSDSSTLGDFLYVPSAPRRKRIDWDDD